MVDNWIYAINLLWGISLISVFLNRKKFEFLHKI